LAIARDRLEPLMTVGAAPGANIVGLDSKLGHTNTIDFCTALNTMAAASSSTNTSFLYTSDGESTRNIAFALALPGLLNADNAVDTDPASSRFDGLNASQTTTNPGFESPTRPQSTSYDDKVIAVTPSDLFASLSCGLGVSAAAHAHFNAANAAQIALQGMYDYSLILNLQAKMAGAGIASATASIAKAAAGLASATSSMALSVAKTLLTYGTAGGLIALSGAAVAVKKVAFDLALGTMVKAIASKAEADKLESQFALVVTKAKTLAASIDANAKAADAAGF
jgi:hypothetical protein